MSLSPGPATTLRCFAMAWIHGMQILLMVVMRNAGQRDDGWKIAWNVYYQLSPMLQWRSFVLHLTLLVEANGLLHECL